MKVNNLWSSRRLSTYVTFKYDSNARLILNFKSVTLLAISEKELNVFLVLLSLKNISAFSMFLLHIFFTGHRRLRRSHTDEGDIPFLLWTTVHNRIKERTGAK